MGLRASVTCIKARGLPLPPQGPPHCDPALSPQGPWPRSPAEQEGVGNTVGARDMRTASLREEVQPSRQQLGGKGGHRPWLAPEKTSRVRGEGKWSQHLQRSSESPAWTQKPKGAGRRRVHSPSRLLPVRPLSHPRCSLSIAASSSPVGPLHRPGLLLQIPLSPGASSLSISSQTSSDVTGPGEPHPSPLFDHSHSVCFSGFCLTFGSVSADFTMVAEIHFFFKK